MAKNWYPIIDMEKCSNCGTCIDFCKHGVYNIEKSEPTVILPEGCIDQCRGCKNRCPENAIIYFGNNEKESTSCSCGCGCWFKLFRRGLMGKCKDCGILMREGNNLKCYRYSTDLTESEILRERDCLFFTEPIYDDGEPMPPAQLVLIKEQDIKRRKMQGPV